MRGDDKYARPIGALFQVGEERRIGGQLRLKRGDLFESNVVRIADDEFVHVDDGGSLYGVSEAGKVSLLECVRGGMLASSGLGDLVMHHGDVSFRYALFGKEHLSAEERLIRGIQFTLEGVESSVFMHDRLDKFGHIHDPDDEILDAIQRNRPGYLKGDLVKGQAMVSYFTGDWDVLPRCETVLGTVDVGRSMSFDLFGRNMEDTPRISIDFDDDPQTLEGAWRKMRVIRQFFGWMMGYAPAWKDVLVFTSGLDEDGFRAAPEDYLEAFGPNEWQEVPESARRFGTLIDASRNPDHFVEVMQHWLARNAEPRRRRANARFFGNIRGTWDRVLEDGIVSAANTFDLLPAEDKPKSRALAADLVDILKEASDKVKDAMGAGAQREEILNALGNIRANRSLRNVVYHRAKVVTDHYGDDKLERLLEVIQLAVQCRNYYTHGGDARTSSRVDFADFDIVCFLTETLEFIYGVSELLLCGWDPATSTRDEWHPLGGYVKSYNRKRSVLPGIR